MRLHIRKLKQLEQRKGGENVWNGGKRNEEDFGDFVVSSCSN